MIQTFEEFIYVGLDDFLNEDFSQEREPQNMPEEFTGDPKTDPYLNDVIYGKEDERMLYTNRKLEGSPDFYPYRKAQTEGNKYYDIWKSLVHWIKDTKDGSFRGLTVLQKDRVLLSTFKSILDKQGELYNVYDTNRRLSQMKWTEYNYNRCAEKWKHYTELAKKIYPDKNQEIKRTQFRRERYENFIRKEGIEKYAKHWIPGFSKSFPMD